MQTLTSRQPVPIYLFEQDEATGSSSFSLVRSAGVLPYEADVLLPHRKAYYMLVFVKHSTGRHWVDAVPYVRQGHALYFSSPSQMLVKEEPTPFWAPGSPLRASFWPCSKARRCATCRSSRIRITGTSCS